MDIGLIIGTAAAIISAIGWGKKAAQARKISQTLKAVKELIDQYKIAKEDGKIDEREKDRLLSRIFELVKIWA